VVGAGTDLNCGGSYSKQLPEAYAQRLVSTQMLRQAAGRAVYGWLELGLFEDSAAAAADPRRKVPMSVVVSRAFAILDAVHFD
jgi:hypothetical protein